jgi:chorismate-pyruvate lyase
MNLPSKFAGPDLRTLFALFAPADDLPEYEFVAADEVPLPYHGLLVHEHHMTVTVEAYHGSLVEVRVLARRHEGDSYARKILLALESNGRIVQFGIARVNLRFCSPAVRAEILEAQTPLGRILIQHNVLRRIEPTAFLRVIPGSAMMGWFGLERSQPTYGRLAYIHCNEQPAIELLEIVAPEMGHGGSRDAGERQKKLTRTP